MYYNLSVCNLFPWETLHCKTDVSAVRPKNSRSEWSIKCLMSTDGAVASRHKSKQSQPSRCWNHQVFQSFAADFRSLSQNHKSHQIQLGSSIARASFAPTIAIANSWNCESYTIPRSGYWIVWNCFERGWTQVTLVGGTPNNPVVKRWCRFIYICFHLYVIWCADFWWGVS